MAGLISLPNELMLKIISFVTATVDGISPYARRALLLRTALTCRRTYRCTKQELWSSIEIDPRRLPYFDRLSSLRDTLIRQPELALMVKQTNLITKEIGMLSDDISAARSVMSILPNLEKLWMDTFLACPTMMDLTSLGSLSLYYPCTADMWDNALPYWDGSHEFVPDVLKSIICLPSLRKLNLEQGSKAYCSSQYAQKDPFKHWCKETTELCIKEFAWSTSSASESFRPMTSIICRMTQATRIVYGSFHQYQEAIKPFYEALQKHKETLKTLILGRGLLIDNDAITLGNHYSHYGPVFTDFREFTALKNLGLGAEFSIDTLPLSGMLPPQLETLQLGYGGVEFRASGPTIGETLNSLLEERYTSHPGLKKIILWDWAVGRSRNLGEEILKELKMFWPKFKQVQVELEWNLATKLQKTPLMDDCNGAEGLCLDLTHNDAPSTEGEGSGDAPEPFVASV